MLAPRRFNDEPKQFRMLQAWLILTSLAACGRRITYGELSEKMFGRRLPRSKAMMLGQLWTYCNERNLPLLPVIVVAAKSKKPAATAPYNALQVTKQQSDVFKFPWHEILPPTEQDYSVS